MTDLQRLRDELAIKNRGTGIISEVSIDRFKEGFDAAVEAMQAENDELNYALKFQTNSLDREMNLTEKLQIENNSLKQALDLAVKALEFVRTDYGGYAKEVEEGSEASYIWEHVSSRAKTEARQALTSINEIINQTKQGE